LFYEKCFKTFVVDVVNHVIKLSLKYSVPFDKPNRQSVGDVDDDAAGRVKNTV